MECRRSAYFRTLRADEKYEHIAFFLHAFLTRDMHNVTIFKSKQSAVILQDMIWVYCATKEVYKSVFVTVRSQAWDKALKFKAGPMSMLCYDD